MLVPSIDLMDGQTVQLVGGDASSRREECTYGDPRPIARQLGIVGEIAVIDLDRALGRASNEALVRDLLPLAACRVGGGIRDVDAAIAWLDAGAAKVILGTAARPEILGRLPRERVIAALDARHGEVVIKGWTEGTGQSILARIAELRDHVSGFLVTFVEREGRMGGTNLDLVADIVRAAGSARVTIAGGITTANEIAELDRLGADAQVGMALYTGRLRLAEAFCAPLTSDRTDGLWPTVVCDDSGQALGLAYSSLESVHAALELRVGAYHSRRRGLWVKGQTTGATQELVSIAPDCDRDALRFVVRQAAPGFCHNGTWTCFGEDRGLRALEQLLRQRVKEAPEGSYTRRLLDNPALLKSKLLEEAAELADATEPGDVAWEAADVLYFAMVAMARAGVSVDDAVRHLQKRSLKVTRRPGDAKPPKGNVERPMQTAE